jgi:hypothetical protein
MIETFLNALYDAIDVQNMNWSGEGDNGHGIP